MATLGTILDNRLRRLVRDYGYDVRGDMLVSLPVAGYGGRDVRRVRGLFDAAEQLIPLLADDEYQARHNRITRVG